MPFIALCSAIKDKKNEMEKIQEDKQGFDKVKLEGKWDFMH